jgi:hypothetical protein
MDMPKPNPVKQASPKPTSQGNPNSPWNNQKFDDQVDRW